MRRKYEARENQIIRLEAEEDLRFVKQPKIIFQKKKRIRTKKELAYLWFTIL